MYTALLPPGDNPIPVNKYIIPYIKNEVALMNAVYGGWYNSEHALSLATAHIAATRFLTSIRE